MSLIYTPKGRAREYSPKALNIYLSCTHGCEYCYAPGCRHQSREQYFAKPYPRKDIAKKLWKELDTDSPKEQVLLSFIGDVYCETRDENRATRDCLEALHAHSVPVAILTKGGYRCLRDLVVFERFGEHIMVGTTLTFDNPHDSSQWEPGAANPYERVDTLNRLHDAGIRTFASFEPVIDPKQSLNLMRVTAEESCVDVYKVGKLNNYNGLDKQTDWTDFLGKAVEILRGHGREFYVKEDLRRCAPTIELFGDETVADAHTVMW